MQNFPCIVGNCKILDFYPGNIYLDDQVEFANSLIEPLRDKDLMRVNDELEGGFSVIVHKVEARIGAIKKMPVIIKSTGSKEKGKLLKNEFMLFNLLMKNSLYDLPKPVMLWEDGAYTRIALKFVEGTVLSECNVDAVLLDRIFAASSLIQDDILKLNTDVLNKEKLKFSNDISFSKQLCDFFLSRLGYVVDRASFQKLEEFLNRDTSKKNRVIVSDCDSSNWIVTSGGGLTKIDLGYTAMGSKEEDWVRFIDSINLKTDFSRSYLINYYLDRMSTKDNRKEVERRLHFIAIYCNLGWFSLFLTENKSFSNQGYNRALESAKFLNVPEIIGEIEAMRGLLK